jgi:hypothetical protein
VLLVDPCAHCDQHREMLNTRYLRLSPRAADGGMHRWVYGRCSLLPQPPAGRFFPGSDTRSVYGRIDFTVCAMTTKG